MGEDKYLRDAEYKADAKDGDSDGFVQDGTIHERPVEVAEVVAVEEIQAPEPKVVAEPEPAAKKVKNVAAVKTNLKNDVVVYMSAVDFSSHARNSASVAAVQTRLIEMGHLEAGSDKRGDIGDGTCAALCAFQKEKGIEAVTCNDQAVIEALFERTTVKVMP